MKKLSKKSKGTVTRELRGKGLTKLSLRRS